MSDEKKQLKPIHMPPIDLEPVIDSVGGKELLDHEEGWVIGVRGNRLMRFPTEKHMITMANTGGGKGTSVAIPNLLIHEGSVFSIEIGGATYHSTVNFREHVLKQNVYVFDPMGATGRESSHLNLLDTLDPSSKSFMSDVSVFARSLLKSAKGTEEQTPYWERVPANVLKALLIHVRTSSEIEEEDRHLPHVSRLLATFPSQEWHELMQKFVMDRSKFRETLNEVGNYFHGKGHENIDSIISTVSSSLEFIKDPVMADISRDSSFNLSDLRNKKTTVYVVMPEPKHYEALSTWLRLLVERSFDAIPNLGDGGRSYGHNDRVLFMLDEFTQLGKLDAIDEGMQTARQKGITIWAMFQDVGRIRKLYGPEIASSFMGAAGVVQVFDVGDELTPEYVSKRYGKNVVYIPSVQHGENWGESDQRNWSDSKSLGTSEVLGEGASQSDSENWSDSHSYNSTVSEGTSVTTGTSFTESVSGDMGTFLFWDYMERPRQYNFSSTTSQSMTGTRNTAESRGRARTVGGGRATSKNQSRAVGQNQQETHTAGGGQSQNHGGNYSISYQPHIIPKLDPSEVESLLGTNNNQILFIRAKNKVMRLVDQRANFYEIPMLSRRAFGPEVIQPPAMIGSLMQLPQLPYQSSMSFDFLLTDSKKEKLNTVEDISTTPLSSGRRGHAMLGQQAYSAKEYGQAKAASDKADSRSFAKDRQKERDIFLGAVQSIEDESLKIAENIAQSTNESREQWGKIEVYAGELCQKRDLLSGVRQHLLAKAECLAQFQARLAEYRADLIDDEKDSASYDHAVARYQIYLRFLGEIREGWRELDAPERPEPMDHDREDLPALSYNEMRKMIGDDIRIIAPDIQNLDDMPRLPRNKHIPNVPVVQPATEIERTAVRMRDGRTRTLYDLDQEISARTGLTNRMRQAVKPEELGLEELQKTRQNLLLHIKDIMDTELEACLEGHEKFRTWLKEDAQNMKGCMGRLTEYERDLQQTAKEYAACEQQMDRHWSYLEGRMQNLNLVNRVLEQRRADVHNRMVNCDEWDRLELQTTRLLDTHPDESKLIELQNPAEPPPSRGQEFDQHHEWNDDHTSRILKPDDPGM